MPPWTAICTGKECSEDANCSVMCTVDALLGTLPHLMSHGRRAERMRAGMSRAILYWVACLLLVALQLTLTVGRSIPIRIKSNLLSRMFTGSKGTTPANRFAWRKLHVEDDKLTLESRLGSEVLVIPRVAGKGGEEPKVVRQPKQGAEFVRQSGESIAVDGVFGFFDLPSGPYLAVITDSEEKYRGHGMEFRLMTKINLVRILNTPLTEDELEEDWGQIELLKKAFKAHELYFSTSHDVTLSCQRRALLDSRQGRLPLWKRADDRFFWNKNLLTPLMEAEAHDWVLPVMSAHIQAERNNTLGGEGSSGQQGPPFTLLLVSRRSCLRQGRRFIMRGIDKEGNVANFVETEQMVLHPEGALTSLVQVRGSIPLFWSSPADLSYTPRVRIHGTVLQNGVCMERHLRELVSVYGSGPLVLVNLIDKKKDQGRLGRALEEVLNVVSPRFAKLCPVRHVWFDFHHECRKMQWGNLAKLVDLIAKDLDDQGFFVQEGRGRVVGVQRGVMRTNCMDCLDRTNVVQNLIARRSLLRQLDALGLFPNPDDASAAGQGTVLELPFPLLEQSLRQLWTSNADAVSLLYAGTNALKRDFTKTGKRTKRGMLADGYNSAKRYVINNFEDEINQLAVEAMLGGHSGGTGGAGTLEEDEERDLDPELKDFWVKALEGGGPTRGAAFWDRPLSAAEDAAASAVGSPGEEEEEDEEGGREDSLPHCE